MPIFAQHPDPRSLQPRPAEDLLSAGTRMGAVELLVADLDTMLAYYTGAITLEVLEHAGDTAVLGRHGRTVVRLRQVRELPPARRGQAGLYHTAVLFEDEPALAAALASVAAVAPTSFTGSADHLVSQAFYFDDPEGNGVELYADRPRDTWRREPSGLVTMASNPLDPTVFLSTHLREQDLGRPTAARASLGHVHLQVGDIPLARRFYVDILGFEVMADIGSALFVAAGGYHHHIGLNTWHSAGAGPRAASLGLGQVNIDLPTADDVAALEARLRDHRITTRHDGAVLRLEDPWSTLIQVGVAA
ncbi:VOC family protein [Kocuria sp. U4B]